MGYSILRFAIYFDSVITSATTMTPACLVLEYRITPRELAGAFCYVLLKTTASLLPLPHHTLPTRVFITASLRKQITNFPSILHYTHCYRLMLDVGRFWKLRQFHWLLSLRLDAHLGDWLLAPLKRSPLQWSVSLDHPNNRFDVSAKHVSVGSANHPILYKIVNCSSR